MAKRTRYSQYHDRYAIPTPSMFSSKTIPDSGATYFDMLAEPAV